MSSALSLENFDSDSDINLSSRLGPGSTLLIHDRFFWIYFMITLFFIIIGVGAILTSDDPYVIVISILWLLSNVALMILVYHASINWSPLNSDQQMQICFVDSDSGCFDANNRVWLFINVLFIVLLIISTLWAGELQNQDSGPLRTMSGILILLGGLVLCGLASGTLNDGETLFGRTFTDHVYILPFWIAVAYLLIWFGLTLYVVLTST